VTFMVWVDSYINLLSNKCMLFHYVLVLCISNYRKYLPELELFTCLVELRTRVATTLVVSVHLDLECYSIYKTVNTVNKIDDIFFKFTRMITMSWLWKIYYIKASFFIVIIQLMPSCWGTFWIFLSKVTWEVLQICKISRLYT